MLESVIAAIVTISLMLFAAGCSDDKTPLSNDPPILDSVSPNYASMGDTITVTGSNFSTDPAMIRLAFSPTAFSSEGDSRYATPISASSSRLMGLVPDGAFSNAVRVESLDPIVGVSPMGYLPPPFPSNEEQFVVRLQPGDVGKAYCAATSYEFTLVTDSDSEEYLLVLFNSAVPPSQTTNYWYTVDAEETPEYVTESGSAERGPVEESGSAEESGPATASESAVGGHTVVEAVGTAGQARDGMLLPNSGARYRTFERRMREEVRGILEEIALERNVAKRDGPIRASVTGPGAPPQTVTFDVIVDPVGYVTDPNNYTTVTAGLKFNGAHTLLYVDQSTYASCITDQEAIDLGHSFDEEIYATNRTYFGSESDMNADVKVAILLTPVVNEMTDPGTASTEGFISGFFNPIDLLPDYVDPGVTNAMEIFYTMVPDPTNHYGNEFPKEYTLEVIRGTLAHEFQHMIMFNYRVIVYGQGYLPNYMEELWIDEGLSHIAEDLNGHYESNVKRANLFLADPGDVTLIYGGDDLEERGASYLFLRYLGDRCGESIFKGIVQSKETGTANIRKAGGESFTELFADWSAACYLSGLGITSDARFNYASIDLRGAFDPLFITEGSYPAISSFAGDVKSMGSEFIAVTIPPYTSLDFTVECAGDGRMNAVVIRLQ